LAAGIKKKKITMACTVELLPVPGAPSVDEIVKYNHNDDRIPYTADTLGKFGRSVIRKIV
jgi:hypothetical protein